MKFPFSITRRITFKQPIQKITSERYLLNQIEDKLDDLDMAITRLGEDELFLQKNDIIKGQRKKDFLRNMRVKVKTDQSSIQIILTTETILIFIFGLLPYGLLFLENSPFPFTFPFIVSFFVWGVGYLSKLLVMQNIKFDIEQYLKQKNAL